MWRRTPRVGRNTIQKARQGGNRSRGTGVQGSGALVQTLIAKGLVDGTRLLSL